MKELIKNKKIVFYLGSLGKGGTERVAVNLAEYLSEKGFCVTIATKERVENEYPVSGKINRVLADISKDEITGSRIVNLYRRVKKLRKIWKEESADLIVSFICKNNYMALVSSVGLGIPVVVSVRSAASVEYPGIHKYLADILFKLSSGIVLQTEDAKKYFTKSLQRKAVILQNPLNQDFMLPEYKDKREPVIVSVGRLDTNKNPQMLIKAFSKIADKFPEEMLEFYGDGDLYDELKQLVKRLNLQNRVIFKGRQADIALKIQRAHIFVLTSRVEGMPNALIEAMFLGLVPVSTDFAGGGVHRLIENGVNGFIVPVEDDQALAECLIKILGNSDLEKKLRNNTYRIRQEVNPVSVNKMWRQYFETIMEKRCKF